MAVVGLLIDIFPFTNWVLIIRAWEEKALLYFVWLYLCSQAANTHAHHVRRKLISDLFFILLKGFSLSQYIQYIHSLYDRDFSFWNSLFFSSAIFSLLLVLLPPILSHYFNDILSIILFSWRYYTYLWLLFCGKKRRIAFCLSNEMERRH